MEVDTGRATIYTDLVLRAAGAKAWQIWERLMATYQGYE